MTFTFNKLSAIEYLTLRSKNQIPEDTSGLEYLIFREQYINPSMHMDKTFTMEEHNHSPLVFFECKPYKCNLCLQNINSYGFNCKEGCDYNCCPKCAKCEN